MKNINTIAIVLLIAGLAGGFLIGMQYQKSQQQPQGQFNIQGQGRRLGGPQNRGNSRGVTGEIISSDDKSITVKLQDGSSKIVLISASTQINKAALATISDLIVGQRVSVFGSNNTDGSVTAANIQLNPQMRAFAGTSSAYPK